MLRVPDLFERIEALTNWQQLNQRAQSAVQDQPGLSARMGRYQQAYWWMDPGAILSMAKAGIEPDHPVAQQAATYAAAIKNDSGLGWDSKGSAVSAGSPDITDVQARLTQLSQPKPQLNPSYYAAPVSQIASLLGKNQFTGIFGKLLNQLPSEWDKLSPDVQRELSGLQLSPTVDDKGNPAIDLGNTDSLSDNARTALNSALGGGMRTQGSVSFKQGGYTPEMAQRYGSRNLIIGVPVQQQVQAAGLNESQVSGPLAANGLPGIPNLSGQAQKGIQFGFMAAAAPLQEVQGQIRNVYQLGVNHENPKWLQSQSDLGVAIGQAEQGQHVDIGGGLFGAEPGSPVVQERQRRERERGEIAGHSVTLGRAIASAADAATGHTVIEPGSRQYQLLSGLTDAAVALRADPTIWALHGIGTEAKLFEGVGSVGKGIEAYKATGAISDAFKAFQDAGGITGLRGTVDADAVNKWLEGDGAHVVNQIANTSDPYLIWRKLGREATPQLTAALADEHDPGAVADLLRGQLGTQIRHQPSVGSFTGAQRFIPGSNLDDALIMPDSQTRWTAMMPHSSVKSADPMANALEVERAGALLKMRDQVPQWFDQMARAGSPTERQTVWGNIMRDAENKLVESGVGQSRARTLTRLNQSEEAVDRAYATRAAVDGTGGSGNLLINDGKPVLVNETEPQFLGQTLRDDINLPDWRELRRQMSNPATRAVLNNPAIKGGENILLGAQNVWKAFQIATTKTMIKVLGDEQLAMAGRGYDSLANHPVHALGMILATPLGELPDDARFLQRVRQTSSKWLRWTGEKIPGVEPQILNTATGHDFETLDDIRRVASHGIDTTVTDPNIIYAKDWRAIYRGQPGVTPDDFLNAHARQLAQYAASPETREFARAGSLAEAQQRYWDGDLANLRQDFAKKTGDDALAVDRGTSDAYVQKQLDQMHTLTNGNPTLLDAIGTGKLDGASMWAQRADGSPKINQNYVNRLSNYEHDFPIATIQQKALMASDKSINDSMFGRAIHILLGTPSAVLSKSPLYRQAYWENMADNASFLDEASQAAVRTNAEAANLPKGLAGELESGLAKGTGELSVDQADKIAQGYAMDIVRRTTHEFSNRSQMFDQLRLLTPFGEIWRKTILRWANIMKENPAVARTLQKGVLQARSPEMGDFMSAGPGNPAGQGFFHKDSYGQEVFTVPFSGMATQAVTGVPVPLAGSVQGLTVGTEIFPALGPVASFPAAWLMQQVHAPQSLQDEVFPYGPPKDPGDAFSYAPAWFRSALGHNRETSLDSPRVFANNVKSVLAYGISNGDYDTSTPEGIQRAVEDATSKAHKLYDLQGAAQYLVPGAPSQQFLVKDKGGKLIDLSLLIKEYNDLADPSKTTDGQPGDPNKAADRFLQKYGPNLTQVVTPKSYAYVFGVPTDENAANWVDQHSGMRRDYPLIYGYFAPPSDPNNFNYEVYKQQFDRGERVPLSPDQWVKVSNARLAAMQYGKARDSVDKTNQGKPPDDNQRAWLAAYKQKLIDAYPGYEEALYGGGGLPSRPEAKILVDQAMKASKDKDVIQTDAGQGLVSYLHSRDLADQAWQNADKSHAAGGWTQASSAYAVTLRNWLRRVGAQTIDQHKQFGPLFDSVFEREMKDDTNPKDLTGG